MISRETTIEQGDALENRFPIPLHRFEIIRPGGSIVGNRERFWGDGEVAGGVYWFVLDSQDLKFMAKLSEIRGFPWSTP